MEMEEAGKKRERRIETEEAGRKKVVGMTTKTEESLAMQSVMSSYRSSMKRIEESRLKQAVARLIRENPDAEPIVVEALTEQERAALVQEEKARERKRRIEYMRQCEEQVMAERERGVLPPEETDPNEDPSELDYSLYRRQWETEWAKEYGSFEDTTPIPPMCFTDNPMPSHTHHAATMQIFTVKVAAITGGLQWPLDVFGMVAVRDDLDHNRNIIFSRTRDNCQTLTEQDPYLVLTGPTRAACEPVYFDAVLKVKGATESEDKDLSLLFVPYNCCESINLCVSDGDCIFNSCVSSRSYTSKLSTLELTCGIVVSSVEATITLRLVEGSWPDGFRGQFTACTASVGHMKVFLLDSGADKVPVAAADGTVELSRRIVSVEKFGQLRVSAVVYRGCSQVAEGRVSFAPLDAGRSLGMLDLGFCKMQVAVAWSLCLHDYPMPATKRWEPVRLVLAGAHP